MARRRNPSPAGPSAGASAAGSRRQRRGGTATSNFGVSRRENHDSSGFYARFSAPVIDLEARPAVAEARRDIDLLFVGDARRMTEVADSSVALVVTSPPYFAGKEYEEAMGEGHVPSSYLDYLDMLTAVFAECVRCLEPGGRMAVNVANLGRRPYRSLSGDVTSVLQDRLGLLLRGEIIWRKQRGAGGNCAWGSFQRPGNPVLRDVTERVVLASKGRFDRALSAAQRRNAGLPFVSTIGRDEFMDATLDLWEFPAESATRVGHPAPFPVALPERLVQLHTYEGDLVLDPFMGSGTTAVAAARTGRHYVGYDTDAAYVAAARTRLKELSAAKTPASPVRIVPAGASGDGAEPEPDPVATALVAGHGARDLAEATLAAAGMATVHRDVKVLPGAVADLAFNAAGGREWLVLVCGSLSSSRGGLSRSDVLWRALGTAAVLRAERPEAGILLMSPEVPSARSAAGRPLVALEGSGVIDAVCVLGDHARLAELLAAEPGAT